MNTLICVKDVDNKHCGFFHNLRYFQTTSIAVNCQMTCSCVTADVCVALHDREFRISPCLHIAVYQ